MKLEALAQQGLPTHPRPPPGVTTTRTNTNDDSGASSRHCEVRLAPGGRPTVKDLCSRNGTYIGTERVQASPLKNGEVIAFGSDTRIYVGVI